MFKVRKACPEDREQLFKLYKKVAATVGGIARLESEITESFIDHIISKSGTAGIELVVFREENPAELLAEIHSFAPEPSVFRHVLSETSIVVDPSVQGKGVGKLLFRSLLNELETHRRDILRLELVVRESNHKAIAFYRSIDFRIEGRLERRIDVRNGKFEADIPMAWFNPNFVNPYLNQE